MAAVTICSDFGAQKNSLTQFPLFPHLFPMCLHKINFWKDNWQLASILKHNMHHIFNGLIPFLENIARGNYNSNSCCFLMCLLDPMASLEAAVCQYWPKWVIRCSNVRGIKHHLRVKGWEVKWLPMEVASSRSKAETKKKTNKKTVKSSHPRGNMKYFILYVIKK